MNNGQDNSVDSLVKTTLDALDAPVERLKFTGEADTFIVFYLVNADDDDFADDEPTTHEHLYRIDFFSKGNYMALLKQARQALKTAGFYGNSINAEFYESSTGYNRISLDSNYLEVFL